MKRIIHNSITKKKYTPPSIYIEDIEPWEMIAESGKVEAPDVPGGNNENKEDEEVPDVSAKSGLWGNTTFDIDDDYEYEY